MKIALWNIQFSYTDGATHRFRRSGSVDVMAPTVQRALAVIDSKSDVWPDLVIHVAQKRTAGSEVLFDPALSIRDAHEVEISASNVVDGVLRRFFNLEFDLVGGTDPAPSMRRAQLVAEIVAALT